jgi:hypothetical protein
MRILVLNTIPKEMITVEFVLFSIDTYLDYIEHEYTTFDLPCYNNKSNIATINVKGLSIQAINEYLDKHQVSWYRYVSIAHILYEDLRKRRFNELSLLSCDATAYTYMKYGNDASSKARKYKQSSRKHASINYSKIMRKFLNKYLNTRSG